MDRNFCVRDFIHGIIAQQAYFIVRQHKGLPWEEDGEEKYIGKSEGNKLYEQWIIVKDSAGNKKRFRRIRIELKNATRDGDKELCLLTNLSKSSAHAKHIA